MLVQMNVVVEFKNQHRYNEDEFLDKIQAEMRSSLMERVRNAMRPMYLLVTLETTPTRR